MKVLCIGLANYDITLPFYKFPKENTKNRINKSIICGGGPVSNAACLLAKYGVDAYFAGIIGKDMYGKKIKDDFINFNVNIDYLEEKEDYNTSIGYIIVAKETESRTIITVKNEGSLSLRKVDLKPDIILIDGQEEAFSKKVIKENNDALVIIDAGTYKESTKNLSYLADYIICSKDFLEGFINKKIDTNDELISSYKALKKEYQKEVVVTLGDKGCLYEVDNKIKIMPSLKVDVNDTTGAGDIFHGTFVYGLVKKMPFEEIIKLSCISSSLSTKYVGGRNSIIDLDELLSVYEKCK